MSAVLNIAGKKQVGKLFSVLAGVEVSDLPLTSSAGSRVKC